MITCKFEDGGEGDLRHACIHAIVIKNNKILLVKRSENIIEGGKWAVPGGYIKRGEIISNAVLRELKEETGWSGEIISLFRINSNPNRPNDNGRQNVMMEFLVKPIEQIGTFDSEQTQIRWFDFDEIDLENMAFDHMLIIGHLKSYFSVQFLLPIIG